ncbi:hypothetical protein MSIBF_A1760011 [groundwater metagenome]|uniref:Uncharacterized protein n=1 Tax=groundwater metagenome TaxID=717931 RepID=A0A098E8Q1_9ZZZZ
MYAVELSQIVYKFLEKLDDNIRIRIENRLRNLAKHPAPSDAKFICRDK